MDTNRHKPRETVESPAKESYMSVKGHAFRRSNLFLVRLWMEQADDGGSENECHGKIQRVVNGEAHQFDSWQSLVDTLIAMQSSRQSSSRGATKIDKPERSREP
jgi:hypothetical protein